MLRGSRDFDDRAAYERFLRELFAQRNSGRTERFAEERAELLSDLPARRVDAWHRRRGAGHPGEHDPHRLQHLLGAQPIDR